MYQLKLVSTEEETLEFEKMRERIFNHGKEITKLSQGAFSDAILGGDMLAFQCLEDKKPIGGMLLRLQQESIKVSRLFVEKDKRGKGAGSFMLKYVEDHKDFFEDYYGTEIGGILVEPLDTSVDYYFNKGYDYSGYQMYKRYK